MADYVMSEGRLQNIRDAVANDTANADDARELLAALDAERMVRADEVALAYEDAAKMLNEEKCIGLPVEQMMDWHRRDWQRSMRRRAEEIRERIHGPGLVVAAIEAAGKAER